MNQERIFQVLLGPHVSEKAAIVADASNQVAFRVAADATKLEVKAAIEQLFKVKVEGVQVLNVKGKTKRNRYGLSRRPSWKKAYVRL
jgi:large subunit ribosomal protein L23